MMTIYEEEEKVFDSICNGASGYLLKKTPPAQIADAVRDARRGGSPLSPRVAGRILERLPGSRAPARRPSPLTSQEVSLVRPLPHRPRYQSPAPPLGVRI